MFVGFNWIHYCYRNDLGNFGNKQISAETLYKLALMGRFNLSKQTLYLVQLRQTAYSSKTGTIQSSIISTESDFSDRIEFP